MPTVAFSPAALALFRLHVERQGQIAVDDSTREPYRKLARRFDADRVHLPRRRGVDLAADGRGLRPKG